MKVDVLFDRVLALLFSDSSEKSSMLTSFLATVNILLDELLANENGMRTEKLAEAQIVTSLDDVLIYNQRILSFLAYGVAGIMLAEDDPNISTQYKNKYENEKFNCVTCQFVEVKDNYGYIV